MENSKQQESQKEQSQQQGHQQQQQKQSSLDELNKVGGFNFIETVVDGVANMNPSRKARKEIFSE